MTEPSAKMQDTFVWIVIRNMAAAYFLVNQREYMKRTIVFLSL